MCNLMRIWLSVVLCVLISASGGAGQNAIALQDVKKIYVDSLGDEPGASAIRSGIVDRLAKSGRFDLVESADLADAVLSGEGHLTKTTEPPPLIRTKNRRGPRTNYQAVATVQLKGKDRQVLWSHDGSHDSKTNKAGAALGHAIANKLVKAATPHEDKQK